MIKKRVCCIPVFFILFFHSTNLRADETTEKYWKYGTIGFGALTIISFGGAIYNYIQLRRNINNLQDLTKNLTNKERETLKNKIDSYTHWAVGLSLLGFFSGYGTFLCLVQWQREANRRKPKKPKLITLPKNNCECSICLDDKSIQQVLHCGHHSCSDCLKRHLKTALFQGGNLEDLRCPDPNCKKSLTNEDIDEIAYGDKKSELILKKHTDMIFTKWFFDQPEKFRRKCPNKKCSNMFIYNGGNKKNIRTCPDCHEKYCANCLSTHKNGISNCRKAKIIENLDVSITHNRKLCMNCHILIERTGGCDHVTCGNCSKQFCFNCYGEGHSSCPSYCRNSSKKFPPSFL